MRLRHFRIGQKLIAIYLLGVFVPLVLVNGTILRLLLSDIRRQNERFVQSMLDDAAEGIAREFEPIAKLAELIDQDRRLSQAIDETYPAFRDVLRAHQEYLQPAIQRYQAIYPAVGDVTIYSTNPALRVANGYLYLGEETRSRLWFERLNEEPKRVVLTAYEEFDNRTQLQSERFISYIRVLGDSELPASHGGIVRIDIRANVLSRHMELRGMQGRLVLRDSWDSVVIAESSTVDKQPDVRMEKTVPTGIAGHSWRLSAEITPRTPRMEWSSRWTLIFAMTGLTLAVSSVFVLLLSRSVTRRLARLSRQMKRVEREDFRPLAVVSSSGDEVDSLMREFNIMAGRIDELINRNYKFQLQQQRQENERQRAELNALQSQANPHFLNNALESIRATAQGRGELETARVISKLGRSVRRLVSWDEDMTSLEEELEFTREYVDVQKYRFGDRVDFAFDIDPNLLNQSVPKLTIQSFVENACIHGVERVNRRVEVRIHAAYQWSAEKKFLWMEVTDNGAGCDPDDVLASIKAGTERVRHVGIRNVYRRLSYHFGERLRFHFDSEPGVGTTVRIGVVHEQVSFQTGDSR